MAFPEDELRQLFPDLVAEWEIVAKLQSVPWPWVAVVELSLTEFLAPTAALYPINSIQIFARTWPFLLHPGSTQTSGLLRLYQDALDEVEREVNIPFVVKPRRAGGRRAQTLRTVLRTLSMAS